MNTPRLTTTRYCIWYQTDRSIALCSVPTALLCPGKQEKTRRRRTGASQWSSPASSQRNTKPKPAREFRAPDGSPEKSDADRAQEKPRFCEGVSKHSVASVASRVTDVAKPFSRQPRSIHSGVRCACPSGD